MAHGHGHGNGHPHEHGHWPRSGEEPAVVARDLSVWLGSQKVLEELTFDIARGSFVGVVGPNGAGKTTLLRVLLGLVRTYEGSIRVFGEPPDRLGERRHMIGYVPQRSDFDRKFPARVLDVVMMGRVACRGLGRRLTREDRDAAVRSLELVDALDLAPRPIGELSGGQQQRVFLARALCSHTRLLLLDEPNTGLDVPAQNQFYELLHTLQHEHGLTIIVVSHDIAKVSQFADRILCINKRLHIHASPAEVAASPWLEQVYGCEVEQLAMARHRPEE